MAKERRRWLSNYPEDILTEYELDNKPLYYYLVNANRAFPKKVALHYLGKEMTYQEVYSDAVKLAGKLVELGIHKGDRVAIMLPNSPQAVIAYYGALIAGAVVVQTNPLYTERELTHQLKDSGAACVICLDRVYPRVARVQGDTLVQSVIVTAIQDYLVFPKNLLFPLIQKKKKELAPHIMWTASVLSFKEIIRNGKEDMQPVELDPENDLALLQYTGGTTGPAKGVMLTHNNLTANTLQSSHWMRTGHNENDSILGVLPFFHVYGMTIVMNLSMMTASKMIILPKFDVEETLKTIEKQKPSLFPGAPTMYIALINHPDIQKYDLSSIEMCISGSAPLPMEVQERFEALTGGKLVEGYGLSEASPVTHCNPFTGMRRNGSIGMPFPNTDAKVVDAETEEEAEPGKVGELMVKGPQVMKGYWNKTQETEQVLKDGWLLTGDMAYMDDNGYFYIVDRKKDMIIASGLNIYPREIEEVLYEHEDVLEAAVVGVPDAYRGETVKAYVVPKKGKTLTEESLDLHCRINLAPYKVPKIYEFRDELPKTMVGKVLKRSLIEENQTHTR